MAPSNQNTIRTLVQSIVDGVCCKNSRFFVSVSIKAVAGPRGDCTRSDTGLSRSPHLLSARPRGVWRLARVSTPTPCPGHTRVSAQSPTAGMTTECVTLFADFMFEGASPEPGAGAHGDPPQLIELWMPETPRASAAGPPSARHNVPSLPLQEMSPSDVHGGHYGHSPAAGHASPLRERSPLRLRRGQRGNLRCDPARRKLLDSDLGATQTDPNPTSSLRLHSEAPPPSPNATAPPSPNVTVTEQVKLPE